MSGPASPLRADIDATQDFWLTHLDRAGAFHRWTMARVLPHLGAAILEIGCGTGTYTAMVAAAGRQVTGIEINSQFAAAAARRMATNDKVRIVQADMFDADLAALGGFDTVMMLDVLEHLDDDVAALAKLAGGLTLGGQIVIKVPAHSRLYGTMDRAIGHRRRYDRAGLAAAARRAGLRMVHCEAFNTAAAPGWWLNGRVLKRSVPPAGQLRLFNLLVPVFKLIDIMLMRRVGISLIAVLAKS